LLDTGSQVNVINESLCKAFESIPPPITQADGSKKPRVRKINEMGQIRDYTEVF
jgi:hypothetical protein